MSMNFEKTITLSLVVSTILFVSGIVFRWPGTRFIGLVASALILGSLTLLSCVVILSNWIKRR